MKNILLFFAFFLAASFAPKKAFCASDVGASQVVNFNISTDIDPRVTPIFGFQGELCQYIPSSGDPVLLIKDDVGVSSNWSLVGPGGGGGSGTVTSVGLALPSIFTVSGSPVTTSGTLTGTFTTEADNTVFAGPASGAAAQPTFRSLVTNDLPVTAVTPGIYGDATHVGQFTVDATGRITLAADVAITGGGSGTVTSVALADGSTAPLYGISGSPVTTAGTLTETLLNETANFVFAGPTSGSASQPAFRALTTADLPAGTGTVTSVAFSDGSTTPIFTITGSPVTSSGTLTESLSTESANLVFAGPATGADTEPTFRSLVAADFPTLPYANQSLSNLTSPTAINQDLIFAHTGSGHTINSQFGLFTTDEMDFISGLPTSVSGSSGSVFINSGTITAASSSGNSGTTSLKSGSVTDSGSTGATGDVDVGSGSNAGSGATGDVVVASGNSTNSGTTGVVELSPGTTAGTRGLIEFQDGSEGTPGYVWTSIDVNGSGHWEPASSGFANQTLSNLTGPTAINQNLTFATGGGSWEILTANTTTTNSDQINIETGTVTTASSGPMIISTGNAFANGGQAGSMNILAGNTENTTAGAVSISSGSASSSPGIGGDLDLAAGEGPTSTSADGGVVSLQSDKGIQIMSIGEENPTPLQFFEETNSFSVNVEASNSTAASYTLVLPSAQGASGTVLSNNGSGTLSWLPSGTISGLLISTQTGTTTATVEAGAGTGATCSLGAASNDTAGQINLTTTATTPAAGSQCQINFALTHANAPYCVFSAANANAANFFVTSGIYLTSTTAIAAINFATPDAAGHAYAINYHCIEAQ